MIHSAHDLMRVRLCQAAACIEDAEQDSPLCRRCATACRPIAAPPAQYTTLPCCSCHEWLTEDQFSHQAKAKSRFGRHPECRNCMAARRRATQMGDR